MTIIVLTGDILGPDQSVEDRKNGLDVYCLSCSTEQKKVSAWQRVNVDITFSLVSRKHLWVCSKCKEAQMDAVREVHKEHTIDGSELIEIISTLEISCPCCGSKSWSPYLTPAKKLQIKCDVCDNKLDTAQVKEYLAFGSVANIPSLATLKKTSDGESPQAILYYRFLFAIAIKEFISDRSRRPTPLYLQQKYDLQRFMAGRLSRDMQHYLNEHYCISDDTSSLVT